MKVSLSIDMFFVLFSLISYSGLEEASRLYYTEKNPEAMITLLEPLHALLEAVRAVFRCLDS